MGERLAHRGPDDSGVWLSPNHRVGFASRRLAILDLSAAGHQPMSTDDGAFWITFNGEIYNYVEVREELQRLGVVFTTGTDTEVILRAYRQWGAHCVVKLNGMFAFAIWEAGTDRLFVARDRFGEKPLYYHETPERLIFASEIKALFVDPRVPRQPDPRAIARYVSLALVDGEEGTFFEGIRQIPPAHYVVIEADGRRQATRYWDIDFDRQGGQADPRDDAEEFR